MIDKIVWSQEAQDSLDKALAYESPQGFAPSSLAVEMKLARQAHEQATATGKVMDTVNGSEPFDLLTAKPGKALALFNAGG